MKVKVQVRGPSLPDERELAKRRELVLETAKKRAKDFVRDLQGQFPQKSLLQLLPVIIKYGGRLAGEMTIERIELNQGNRLSVSNRVFLQRIKAQLAEQNNTPAGRSKRRES